MCARKAVTGSLDQVIFGVGVERRGFLGIRRRDKTVLAALDDHDRLGKIRNIMKNGLPTVMEPNSISSGRSSL